MLGHTMKWCRHLGQVLHQQALICYTWSDVIYKKSSFILPSPEKERGKLLDVILWIPCHCHSNVALPIDHHEKNEFPSTIYTTFAYFLKIHLDQYFNDWMQHKDLKLGNREQVPGGNWG